MLVPRARRRRRHACARIRACARAGMAPIEMILVLPLLMVLFLCVLSLGTALLARIDAQETARHAAWLQRHRTPPPLPLRVSAPDWLGQLPGQPINQGLARDRQIRLLQLPKFLSAQPVRFEHEHHVLAGSWDYQTIPFRPHARLKPDPRFGVFTPGRTTTVNLSAFSRFPEVIRRFLRN